MSLKPLKSVPVLIAFGVILISWVIELGNPYSTNRLECMTYDLRVGLALKRGDESQVATNLGFVEISDQTIGAVNDGSLGYSYGLYWPRHVYGRGLTELCLEGAKAVGFDVIFANRRFDHSPVVLPDGSTLDSDEYFAAELRKSGTAVLAADHGVMPIPLFRTNSLAVANIGVERDPDGVLRRDKAFENLRIWHPIILAAAAEYGFDLTRTRIDKDKFILYREREGEKVAFPLDAHGKLHITDFSNDPLPAGVEEYFLPYTTYRAWSMGIVMAARELGLDLAQAKILDDPHRVIIPGPNGMKRVIPLDRSNKFLIEWSIVPNSPVLAKGNFEELLQAQVERDKGNSELLTNRWKDKLVFIGSVATGNDLTDLGATPWDKEAFLVSKHWNVANSVITNRFITICPTWTVLLMIALVAAFSAWVTWVSKPVTGSLVIGALMVCHCALSVWLYLQYRLWLPLVMPCFVAGLLTHVCTVTYRVRVEQSEKKRVKSVFSRVVSPNVVNELLNKGAISLGGVRRELTVFFADIRGFTELTDTKQTRAEEFVRQNNLGAKEAELVYDEQAQEILRTVSSCLGLIAETIKKHDGTLDKYIGDCVMAFWGAPAADPQHALHCVRAAIEAQRALHRLNEQRTAENRRIEQENQSRAQMGLPVNPLLPLISLGTGINTGQAIVGLMGSEADILNYTVFGREVNLAARLEGVSGHGRIVIGLGTFEALKRDDPVLAAKCAELPPVKVKGFRDEVKAYEVIWKE